VLYQWLLLEHARLHTIEAWPDTAQCQAALAAARSAIDELSADPRLTAKPVDCMVCRNRERSSAAAGMINLPDRPMMAKVA
jgi:hypothetical protein